MKRNELIKIVEQAKNGNKEAFRCLYEEYYDRLYFFILKNVDSKEAAEDITHDTFLKSMEKINTLEKPENYVTWLHSIAYNKCTDMFRSRKCNVYFDNDEDMENAMDNLSLNEPIMVPEDYATDNDRARQLKSMIDSLKPDMKSALVLYYYNDMSISDVAKTMGITENNVKQKLLRARKKLKSKIEELGGKGIMLSAVPMNELLHRTVSPKKAAAMAAAKSGTAFASIPLMGKIAGISAAAAISVGVPMTLSHMNKNADIAGNVRVHDSSVVVEADASSTADITVEELTVSSSAASDVSVPEKTDNSTVDGTDIPKENFAPAAPGSNAIDVTPAVTISASAAPAESASETISAPEEKKETQPVEMTAEKLFSMTNSELRELSNNDFKVVDEPGFNFADSGSIIFGIKCNAFPNYIYFVDYRNEEGQPSGPLDAPDRWHGDQKVVLDSEEVRELIVQGNESLGEGISVGMTYSQIKEANGSLHLYNDRFAHPWINGKVWGLHFVLTAEEKALINQKFDEIALENEGSNDIPMIDLTELGIDPVCDYAYIYNTYNGVRVSSAGTIFVDQ
ncbi:RNA polymerase sigma factor [Ruminococcus albus]|uniref:RNA polymerase, sigma-24 subunit, ECF subfamily n=1 Tax=Ruminococcus albus (strain ATCC 27210 / DSM 20455 / JCM 14654 / NCDO 2250 / 7) TaxID=697329 RepID=E6UIS9_RUMA7|nr:sigma-70 family RNA polymerase sigma factor [Ruminococcus albus]ADU21381.1 RNA polymerase, sigma-24 subunit, ECF subfamily [Ruminococcus albus 7 = DSM 20455]